MQVQCWHGEDMLFIDNSGAPSLLGRYSQRIHHTFPLNQKAETVLINVELPKGR